MRHLTCETLFTVIVLSALALTASAADWQPVPGHLMTRWAKQSLPNTRSALIPKDLRFFDGSRPPP
jgi:hypothetical protein